MDGVRTKIYRSSDFRYARLNEPIGDESNGNEVPDIDIRPANKIGFYNILCIINSNDKGNCSNKTLNHNRLWFKLIFC
jgi:hypothetical protein